MHHKNKIKSLQIKSLLCELDFVPHKHVAWKFNTGYQYLLLWLGTFLYLGSVATLQNNVQYLLATLLTMA